MPNIAEGLEAEGEPFTPSSDVNSDSGFESALARQVGANDDSSPSAEESAPVERYDPRKESADDILRNFDDGGLLKDIKEGITVKAPPTEEERYREYYRSGQWRADSDAFDDRIYGNTKEDREAERIAEAEQAALDRSELAGHRFRAAAEAAFASGSEPEFVAAVNELRAQVPSDEIDTHLLEFAERITGVDLGNEEDVDRLNALSETWSHLSAIAKESELRRAAEEGRQQLESVSAQIQQLWPEVQKQALRGYFKSQGVTTEAEAQERLAHVLATAEGSRLFGVVPPDSPEFIQEFARLDANDQVAKQTLTERALHLQILGADDRTVSGGLKTLSNGRMVSSAQLEAEDALNVPLERLATDPRFAQRVDARLSKGRATTVGDLRQAVGSSDGRSVAHGLTGPNNKPIAIEDATGARARHEKEQLEKRARTMAIVQ